MKAFTRGLALSLAMAGLLGSAGTALAAGKIECSMSKEGKLTTRMVASAAECTRLGGKVAESKAAPGGATAPAKSKGND